MDITFDGSFRVEMVGAGFVLRNDKGHDMVFSFKLDFLYTNNITEYESSLISLITTKEASVQ